MHLTMLLEMAAEGAPDRVVVGDRSVGMAAVGLLHKARTAAEMFRATGAEYVAFLGMNSDALPVALFGAAFAGIPFVPLTYRATDHQLREILSLMSRAVVVCEPADSDRLSSLGVAETITPAALLRAAPPGAGGGELPLPDPESVAIMLFTSGTTGSPKAAVLRHRHLAAYVISSVEFMGSDPAEAQLVSVPPYHIAGIAAVLTSVYGGRRIVYLEGFEAGSWVTLVAEQAVTQAMVVPTMLGRILDVLDRRPAQLPSLRHLSYGGGRMPVELIERAMRRLPDVDFVNAYGLTETSSTISLLTPEDHREAFASADESLRRRLGSVGRPLESVELEIRDADGEAVPLGRRGEVWVRGEQVAGEYVGATVLTPDGWFRTRDAGYLDDAGYLYLEGRLDDVIVRGAENISPGEIEDVLRSHPAVAEAAVVGVPDSEWGEAVAAAIVLADGMDASAAELQDWVRERLRSTRTPRSVEFRTELPYTETGKLLRRVLRAELSAPEIGRPLPSPEVFDAAFREAAESEWTQRVIGADLPPDVDVFSFITLDGLHEIAEVLADCRDGTLLDLACGRGGPGLWLARQVGSDLIGVDFSPVGIDYARSRAADVAPEVRVDYIVADAADTNLPGDSVDGIFCVDAIQLMAHKSDVLAEVRRVLKPGGRAVFTTWEAAGHLADLAAIFEGAGLLVVSVEERPEWLARERAIFEKALAEAPLYPLDAGLQSLAEEASRVLPLSTRRVVGVAQKPR